MHAVRIPDGMTFVHKSHVLTRFFDLPLFPVFLVLVLAGFDPKTACRFLCSRSWAETDQIDTSLLHGSCWDKASFGPKRTSAILLGAFVFLFLPVAFRPVGGGLLWDATSDFRGRPRFLRGGLCETVAVGELESELPKISGGITSDELHAPGTRRSKPGRKLSSIKCDSAPAMSQAPDSLFSKDSTYASTVVFSSRTSSHTKSVTEPRGGISGECTSRKEAPMYTRFSNESEGVTGENSSHCKRQSRIFGTGSIMVSSISLFAIEPFCFLSAFSANPSGSRRY